MLCSASYWPTPLSDDSQPRLGGGEVQHTSWAQAPLAVEEEVHGASQRQIPWIWVGQCCPVQIIINNSDVQTLLQVGLAQTFGNIEFLGCQYPKETMDQINELSFGIVTEFRENQKGKLQRTFVSGSTAANKKVNRLWSEALLSAWKRWPDLTWLIFFFADKIYPAVQDEFLVQQQILQNIQTQEEHSWGKPSTWTDEARQCNTWIR